MPAITAAFSAITHDAVLWKAGHIWGGATDPDEQAAAMDQLTVMLLCIGNDVKRGAYVKNICDANKLIKQKDLKKALTDEQKRREKEAANKVMQQKFANTIQSAEDAGLPEDFRGSKKDILDAIKFGVYEHENVYYTRGGRGGGDYAISNFTMRILYHVDTSDEQAFRLIAVKNIYGFEVVINMNTDDFVTLGSFRKVLARRGDFIFKGADSDLTRLQEFLQRDEIKTVYIKTLGYHPRGNFWAWANGIMPLTAAGQQLSTDTFIAIDEHGIIPYDGKNYFIPACSKMYREKDEQFVNEKKFIYMQLSTVNSQLSTFEAWSDVFYKAYGKKSIPAILFFIGSIFRDIIMKQVQRYPLLNLFGPPGAGKGQMAESLMAMFGEKQDQIMLGGASTVVGFMRKFAQFRNAIVWLDEYKNNLPLKFIESFKNIYDGKGYERGKMTNDFTTESTPIHSSCILSGQDMPTQEPALFMRVIMLAFEEGKFTDVQRENYKLLKDAEATGLSSITAELFAFRTEIQQHFKEKLDIVFKETMRETANTEIDDRMIMNISILLTIMHILAHSQLSILNFPFTYKQAQSFLIENMRHQHAVLAGNNDVNKFWGVIESMFAQDIVKENHDFMLEDGYIFLRLMQVHPLYVKELKQRGDNNFLSKSTLEHYLKLDNTVYVDYVRKRFTDGSNNWCYKMKYARLNIDLIKIVATAGQNNDQYKESVKRRYSEMGVESGIEIPENEGNPF